MPNIASIYMYTLGKLYYQFHVFCEYQHFLSRSMPTYPEVVIQIHELGLHPLLHQTQTEGRNVDVMLQ